MKLKLRSKKFLRDNEDRDPGTNDDMLRLGGKTVTTNVSQRFLSKMSKGTQFNIKEDGGTWGWCEWMFEDFPNTIAEVELGMDIEGNDYATIDGEGDVEIGCTLVPFKLVEKIYKIALKERNKKKRK